MLPSATVMAGFTGGVRVISDRNGNLAFNVLRLPVRRYGRTVYETASVFSDSFKRLICSLTPKPLKRTVKSLMNRRRLIINACYLILALSCQYMVCYAAYIEDIQLSRLSSLGVGFAVSALYLRKVIYSIRNLVRQWHIVERQELLFRACLSECALFFSVSFNFATTLYMYWSIKMHKPILQLV